MVLPMLCCCLSLDGVLGGIHPELDTFSSLILRYRREEPGIDDALFTRSDKAHLSISSSVHASAEQRKADVATAIESYMQLLPEAGSPADQRMHWSVSGNPVGDQIYNFEGNATRTIQFNTGAETISLVVKLEYGATKVDGRFIRQIGDYATDWILVEDVARRVLGRSLAWQHFKQLRGGEVQQDPGDLADGVGAHYVSVATWAANNSVAVEPVRSVGYRFTYHGKEVLVLTGAGSVRVDGQWKSLNGYALEVANRPFVPRQAFLAALP